MKPKAKKSIAPIPAVEVPKETALRRLLFVPCETRDSLRDWIRVYLDIHLPDCTVSDESNSNPMNLVWTVYDALRRNTGEWSRIMAYANRGGCKTLGASILEVLTVLHLQRNVAHMAAIFEQSKKSQEYVRNFFSRPYIQDFKIGDNLKKLEICRYYNPKTGESLTEGEWEAVVKGKYDFERISNYIQIVLCTMQGANSCHSELFLVDEIDVIPKQNIAAYKQAQAIPDSRNGMLPITLLTSTRKSRIGLVQKEITMAQETGLQVWHWNVIDTMEACPVSRHKPELPKAKYYICDDAVRHVTEDGFNLLNPTEARKYYPQEGFAGCEKCPLFPACKGRLATHQISKSPMLKPILDIAARFKSSSAEFLTTEYLCRKPDTTGIIYPRLSREIHVKTPEQIAEMISGEPQPGVNTKAALIAYMKDQGVQFYGGMDFGFGHNFAVVIFGVWGGYAFVVEVLAIPNLELDDKILHCEPLKELYGNPTFWGDTEAPADIKTFKRKGFRMKSWDKYKGSVKGGIEIVRMMLWPSGGTPKLYFLADDRGCDFLISQMERYHFVIDAAGDITEEPDKVDDDECFTASTQVLTGQGWVSLSEVEPGMEVLAVDEKGIGKWETPEIIQKPYKGKGWKIDHHHLSFTATEHHRHSVMSQSDWKVKKTYKLQKREVSEMHGEMYWANNLSSWPEGTGVFEQGEDEAWFAGFWIAEGCFDTGRPTYLIVDQTKTDRQDEIREHLKRLSWTWSETKNDESVRFVVSRQKERALLWREEFGSGAKNKKLKISTIMSMTEGERRAFWEGYMEGDGCRTQSCWHFDTVSPELANGIQILSLSLGYGCRIVSYDCMREGRLFLGPKNGKLYSASQSFRGHILRKKPVAHIGKSTILPVELDEMVYCVRTSTGSFLARCDGKPFVAGNCDALRYGIMNHFAPRGNLKMNTLGPIAETEESGPRAPDPGGPNEWMMNIIREHTESGESSSEEKPDAQCVKKGGFVYGQ